MLRDQLLEERRIAVDVLRRAEVQRQDLGGRIVDGAEQRELGTAPLEPRERAAVDLHERAAGGCGDPAATGPGRAATMVRRLPKGTAQPTHRLPPHREPVDLAEFLRQMRVVEARVGRRH